MPAHRRAVRRYKRKPGMLVRPMMPATRPEKQAAS
jgi:hypothetical protein